MFRLKCTQFDFGWGSAPYPAGGANYSAPPDPIAAFKGPISKGGEVEGEKVEGKGGRGKEMEGSLRPQCSWQIDASDCHDMLIILRLHARHLISARRFWIRAETWNRII